MVNEALGLFQQVVSVMPNLDGLNPPTKDEHQGLRVPEKYIPHHVCPACGELFKNRRQLLKHRHDNLHEDYHVRYRGKHRCTMCAEDFETKEDFLEHWEMEKWHGDHALTILHLGHQVQADDEGWEISPAEGALIERRIKNVPDNKALKYKRSANRLVVETIKHHIKNTAMIVSECYGIPDAGKSWFILSLVYTVIQPLARKKLALLWLENTENELAMEVYREEQARLGRELGKYQATRELMQLLKQCQMCKRSNIRDTDVCPSCGHNELEPVWRDPKVIITFTVNQTVRAMRDARPYDTIVQDEDPALVGAGRDTTIRRIENLLKTMRVRCINFMFISPSRVKYVENSNLVFEVLYKRPRTWETKVAFFDREHVALGWVVLKVLNDQDSRMKEYQERKEENVKSLAANLGAESAEFSFEEIQRDAKKALKRLFENVDKERVLDFAVQDFIEYMPALGIKDAGYYQSRVAKEMHFMAAQMYSEIYLDEDIEDLEDENGYEDEEDFPTTFSLNDEDYLKYVAEDTVDPKWIDAWKRYREKESGYETYANVAEQVMGREGASSGYVSDQFKKIKGSIAFIKGGMFELEMLRLYESSENVEYMKPAPDFRYPDGLAPQGVPDRIVFLSDGSVRVCAWKVYDKENSFEIQRKGKPCPEIVAAQELVAKGREVRLVVEGLYKGEFFSKEIDPDTEDKVVTIYKRDCKKWPPKIEELLKE